MEDVRNVKNYDFFSNCVGTTSLYRALLYSFNKLSLSLDITLIKPSLISCFGLYKDIYSTGSETLAFVIDKFFVVDSFFPLIMVVASKWPCLWLGLECIIKEFSFFFFENDVFRCSKERQSAT